MYGSSVRNCASTAMPLSMASPAALARSIRGTAPIPTTTRSQASASPPAKLHRQAVRRGDDPVDRHAEPEHDARALVPGPHQRGHSLGHPAHQRTRRHLEHDDLALARSRAGRDFEADEAGTDHHDAAPRRKPLPHRQRLVEGPQGEHAGQCRAGDRQGSGSRSGGQQQAAVSHARPVRQDDLPTSPVDIDGRDAGPMHDPEFCQTLLGDDGGGRRRCLCGHHGLGQRWPLIGTVQFIADQRDRPGEAVLPQGHGGAGTRLPGSHDHHPVLAHRRFPP